MAVSALASVAALCAVVMALTLVYWQQMVPYWERERRDRAGLLVA